MFTHANQTHVRELVLYTVNDGDLYCKYTQPILNNLAKHIKRGKYDQNKALIAWKHLADAAAKQYSKGYDSPIFSLADRKATALELADYYAEELGLAEPPIKIWVKN